MRILFLLILILAGCRQKSPEKTLTNPAIDSPIVSAAGFDYLRIKSVCQKFLSKKPEKLPQYIADSLVPCWYGTPWDFNGCTITPQKGKIACGYFVTTVLKDAGVNINRVKMATCPSSILIKAVCSEIKTYGNKPVSDFISRVKQKEPGLFIVGLDKHTGFIYNDGSDVYFIHSSYYAPKCVVKEKAAESPALIYSNIRMIGRIKL